MPSIFSHNSSKVEKMTAAVTAASAAALSNPLVLNKANKVAAVGVAVVGVSTFDTIGRK